MKRSLTKRILLGVFLWTVLSIMYLPLLLLVVFSFSETATISFSNFQFGFGLWRDMFASQAMMGALFNTIFIASVSAFIATIIGTMACVGILNMRKKAKAAVMNLNNVSFINADIVTSFSLVILFVTLGMANIGYFRLIMAHILICIPIVVLTVLPRLRLLDKDMLDAAVDLGAKPMRAFWSVIVPQLIPAMIGGFLLGFTLSLDDFIITQYNKGTVETISTLVYNATKRGVPATFRALSALIFGIVIFVLIIYNIVARKKVKGGKKVKRATLNVNSRP